MEKCSCFFFFYPLKGFVGVRTEYVLFCFFVLRVSFALLLHYHYFYQYYQRYFYYYYYYYYYCYCCYYYYGKRR